MGIDRGGIGEDSAPDGILDADQCGDLTADGVVTPADVLAARAFLAALSTPAAVEKCNVAGAAGSDPQSCDLVDVAVLRRALAGLAPAPTAGCGN
jgi:hypothetical protein